MTTSYALSLTPNPRYVIEEEFVYDGVIIRKKVRNLIDTETGASVNPLSNLVGKWFGREGFVDTEEQAFQYQQRGGSGENGWSPILTPREDDDRLVLQITSWVGGAGDMPAVGQYLGSTGLVSAIADGTDIKGTDGYDGNDGWSPILASVVDGNRVVSQIIDWTGGEGDKPAVNQYIGATGLVDLIADGVNIRGASAIDGNHGFNGWTPTLTADVVNPTTIVLRVSDWVGGTGEKPAVGEYVGTSGLVANIADAVNIRGTDGNTPSNGTNGFNGWSPVFANVDDGERRVLRVVDWTGGTGTKPAINRYLSSTGFTNTLANAVDIRGGQGIQGMPGEIGGSGRPVDWLSVQDTALSAGGSIEITTATGLTQDEIYEYGAVYFFLLGNGRQDDIVLPLNQGSLTVGHQASGTATATINGTTLSSSSTGVLSKVFLVPKGASAELDEAGVITILEEETYRRHEYTDLLALGDDTKTVSETSDATNTSMQLWDNPLLPLVVDPLYFANPVGETKIVLSEFLATYTGSGFPPRITRIYYSNMGGTVVFESEVLSLVVGETNTDGIELSLAVNIGTPAIGDTFRLQVDYESVTHIVGQLDFRIGKASIYRNGVLGEIIDKNIKIGLNEEIKRIGVLEDDVEGLQGRNNLTDDDEAKLVQLIDETRERNTRVPVSEYFYAYNGEGTSPQPNPNGVYTEDSGLIVPTRLFIKGSYANKHRNNIMLVKNLTDTPIGGAEASLVINGISYFRWDLGLINTGDTLELIVMGSETRLEMLNRQDDLEARVATDEVELKTLEDTLGGLKDIGELVTKTESDEVIPVLTDDGNDYGLVDRRESNGSLKAEALITLKSHGISIMRTITSNGNLYNLRKSSTVTVPLIRNTDDNQIEVRQEIPATAQTTNVVTQYGSTSAGRTELSIEYSNGQNQNVEIEWDTNIEYPALVGGVRKWQFEIKIYLNGNLESDTTENLTAGADGADATATFELLNFRGAHSLQGRARHINGGYVLDFIDNGSPYGLTDVRIAVKVKYQRQVVTPAVAAHVEWLHVADNYNDGGLSCFFQESNAGKLLVGTATTKYNATFTNTGIDYSATHTVEKVDNAGDVILHVRSDANNMDITPSMLAALPARADLRWAGMYRAMNAHNITVAFNSRVSVLNANGVATLLGAPAGTASVIEEIGGAGSSMTLQHTTLHAGKNFTAYDLLVFEVTISNDNIVGQFIGVYNANKWVGVTFGGGQGIELRFTGINSYQKSTGTGGTKVNRILGINF